MTPALVTHRMENQPYSPPQRQGKWIRQLRAEEYFKVEVPECVWKRSTHMLYTIDTLLMSLSSL